MNEIEKTPYTTFDYRSPYEPKYTVANPHKNEAISDPNAISPTVTGTVTDMMTPHIEKVEKLESRLNQIQELSEKIERQRRQEYLMKINHLKEEKRAIQKMCFHARIINFVMLFFVIAAMAASVIFCTHMMNEYRELGIKYDGLITDYNDMREELNDLADSIFIPVERTAYHTYNDTVEEVEEEVVVEINTTDITKPSNLTAEQLNEIIDAQLEDIGREETKFSNIGEALVQMEQESQVNALFCLAVGSLESGHGTSTAAKSKNNLFGIMSGSEIRRFSTIEDCISYWGKLIRDNYIDNGRTTIGQIQAKYCPGSTIWESSVSHFMTVYTSHVNS